MHAKYPFLLPLSFALAACHSGSDSGSPDAPLVVNRGIAAHRLFGAGELRLVAASEGDQGLDLDGDGDLQDIVLQILDLESGSLINTELAFPPRFRRDEVPPAPFACNDSLGVFQVSEAETGRDLDQDGNPGEVTTWIYHRRTGRLASLSFLHSALVLDDDLAAMLSLEEGGEIALRIFDARDGSLATPALAATGLFAVQDDLVAFAVAEDGVTDLNADGDAIDAAVVHLYDARTRQVVNTRFQVHDGRVHLAGGFAGFSVSEADHGVQDLDGDGDAQDVVFVAVDGRTGLTRLPGLQNASLRVFQEPGSERFLFDVLEGDDDRNGDGDALDTIAVLYDPREDRVIDSRLAVPIAPVVESGRWVGLSVSEDGQGLDLDGDGRIESSVLHVLDTRSGASTNLGFQGFWLAALEGHLLGLLVRSDGDAVFETELVSWSLDSRRLRLTGLDARDVKGAAGEEALLFLAETERDLNGDGDATDITLALFDARTGGVRSLGLASTSSDSLLSSGGRAAVLVSEAGQGQDLNGDGDQLDGVLHGVLIAPPRL